MVGVLVKKTNLVLRVLQVTTFGALVEKLLGFILGNTRAARQVVRATRGDTLTRGLVVRRGAIAD